MSLVEKAMQKAQAQLEKRRDGGEASNSVRREELPVPKTVPAADVRPSAASFVPSGPIVQIDSKIIRDAGLLPVASQERMMVRQLRSIKYNLLRRVASIPASTSIAARTVMITSALPGDGKSSLAINLAMSLALEKDLKVVLIDADMPKPHLTSALGLTGQRGLLDVIVDRNCDPSSVVRATNINGLYCVPAGSRSDVATELLSSTRMLKVAQNFAAIEPNMLVLFDSSPLLLTSESSALASLASQIVMVVRSGVSPQSAVKDALAMLSEAAGRISLVLNDSRDSGLKDYRYGYGFNSNDQNNAKDTASP